MTDDVLTETVCESCGKEWGERSELEPNYCPSCGTEDPWIEQPMYDFEDVDLPIVFSEEKHDDHYGLWRSFCAQAFGVHEIYSSNIANFPDGMPRMKYSVVEVYWKVTENLKLKGPFLDKDEARDA